MPCLLLYYAVSSTQYHTVQKGILFCVVSGEEEGHHEEQFLFLDPLHKMVFRQQAAGCAVQRPPTANMCIIHFLKVLPTQSSRTSYVVLVLQLIYTITYKWKKQQPLKTYAPYFTLFEKSNLLETFRMRVALGLFSIQRQYVVVCIVRDYTYASVFVGRGMALADIAAGTCSLLIPPPLTSSQPQPRLRGTVFSSGKVGAKAAATVRPICNTTYFVG